MAYDNLEAVSASFASEGVLHVQLNRPKKLNAFNKQLREELHTVFKRVKFDPEVRAVVLSGNGKLFTAGLDLTTAGDLFEDADDPARQGHKIRINTLEPFQDEISSVERCERPVIAVVHNGCLGAGVDLITACDIRYCTQDAYFSVKEVDIGMAADVGTLQRLPKIVGNDSLVREMCYTGRNVYAEEALKFGLVSKVLPTREDALAEALKTAKLIAEKSPVAVLGTKVALIHARDHSVPDSLAFMATWNQGMLNTNDLGLAAQASLTKQKAPKFAKL
ncbi:uncharacterized protein VTP21DRAFT_6619 [Calcarisporiella thermophila]|uniref:uncharacterized protein n=1 Tax=Calcarisporiella thermophila TaxID=911321 RepID=UPI00374285FB